jgi:hypothetical protein
MSDVIIKVENLSKKYILSHQSQERQFNRDEGPTGPKGMQDPLGPKGITAKTNQQAFGVKPKKNFEGVSPPFIFRQALKCRCWGG